MDLRQLRYVIAVAEEGNFARAAERLHIVPSALSMQIRQLEESLGGTLFHRTTRRVELTEAGRVFVDGARAVQAEVDALHRNTVRELRGDLGQLRVGFSGGKGIAEEMADHLRVFHRRHPGVDITIREMGPVDQYEALRTRQLDIGYTALLDGLPQDLAIHRTWAMDWHVLMAHDHPLAGHETVTPDMLGDQTLVTYDAQTVAGGEAYPPARLLHGVQPRVVRTNSVIAVLSYVAAGLGVTLVPGTELRTLMPSLVSRPLLHTPASFQLVMISHRQVGGAAVRRFIDEVTGATD